MMPQCRLFGHCQKRTAKLSVLTDRQQARRQTRDKALQTLPDAGGLIQDTQDIAASVLVGRKAPSSRSQNDAAAGWRGSPFYAAVDAATHRGKDLDPGKCCTLSLQQQTEGGGEGPHK